MKRRLLRSFILPAGATLAVPSRLLGKTERSNITAALKLESSYVSSSNPVQPNGRRSGGHWNKSAYGAGVGNLLIPPSGMGLHGRLSWSMLANEWKPPAAMLTHRRVRGRGFHRHFGASWALYPNCWEVVRSIDRRLGNLTLQPSLHTSTPCFLPSESNPGLTNPNALTSIEHTFYWEWDCCEAYSISRNQDEVRP